MTQDQTPEPGTGQVRSPKKGREGQFNRLSDETKPPNGDDDYNDPEDESCEKDEPDHDEPSADKENVDSEIKSEGDSQYQEYSIYFNKK